ncbi:hypothetical protein [Ferrimonas sediminum]|uniref:hypothetical protein n=1 Tax=Ferrimonas sediminum TaxID=718193 RepID=UPI0015A06763|nr:hypothetical protein [Ferrimonas sediminum]
MIIHNDDDDVAPAWHPRPGAVINDHYRRDHPAPLQRLPLNDAPLLVGLRHGPHQ